MPPAFHRILIPGAALAFAAGVAASKPKPLPSEAIMPPLKPAVIDDTIAISGEELAARKVRSRLTVDVGVNGTGPYRFVVDSGADTSVIGSRLASALNLPAGETALLNSMTETTRVERVLVDSLHVGSAAFRDLELPRLEERHIGAAGMLGLDALVDQRMMLDFERRRITIGDASRPAPRLDGEIVVTARLQRGQLILTQVKAAGRSLDAVVDTGSEITIGNMALRDQIVRQGRANLQTLEMFGVTGKPVMIEIATIARLQVGSITFSRVPIAFADLPPFTAFGLKDRPALLLGTDLMENFRKVSLDFKSRRVRFQLRRCDGISVRMTTTGEGARLSADSSNPAVCSG